MSDIEDTTKSVYTWCYHFGSPEQLMIKPSQYHSTGTRSQLLLSIHSKTSYKLTKRLLWTDAKNWTAPGCAPCLDRIWRSAEIAGIGGRFIWDLHMTAWISVMHIFMSVRVRVYIYAQCCTEGSRCRWSRIDETLIPSSHSLCLQTKLDRWIKCVGTLTASLDRSSRTAAAAGD